MSAPLFLGIDLGSITVKVVLTSEDGHILFKKYQRHGAASRQTLASILEELYSQFPDAVIHGAVTGSGALNLAKSLGLFLCRKSSPLRALSQSLPPDGCGH